MKHRMLRRFSAVCMTVLTAALCSAVPVQTAAESVFTESTETLLNPGMGYTSTLWYRCAPGKTEVQNPTGALVLMFIDIGAFSSGENGTTDVFSSFTEAPETVTF